MEEMQLHRDDVVQARGLLAGRVVPSPLERSDRLSALAGREVWLKREDRQPVRSYKLRGAWVAIAAAVECGAGGVVCASAGNHAQGVAWACRELGIRGVVVLPSRTPRQKRERIAAIGGDRIEILVAGQVYDDAAAEAHRIAERDGLALIPAFDDPLVVCGQGTVGLEIVDQLAEAGLGPAHVVAPVGGGGLLAGLALALDGSGHTLTGVEPAGAASFTAAIAHGSPVRLPVIDTFVDGAAVARLGDVPWQVLTGRHVPVCTVAEGAVATAMLELYQSDGIIAEPAGALAVAALTRVPGNGPVVLVVSGGNNDVSRYAEVLERSLVHRGLKQYFLVEFDQVPGALRRFLDGALGPGDDIVLFEYTKKSNRESGPALVGIELEDPSGLEALCDRMDLTGIRYERVEPGSPLQRFLV